MGRRASSVVRDGIIYLDRNNFQRDFGYFSSMIFEGSKIPFVSPCDKEMSGYIMFG